MLAPIPSSVLAAGARYRPVGADPEAWGRSSSFLDAALAYSGGSHTLADLWDGVLSGDFQFWPGVESAGLTELYRTPRHFVCNVFLAGGRLSELLAMMPDVETWAAAKGCNRVEFGGRMRRGRADGWARLLGKQGFKPEVTVFGKELADG